MAVSFLRNGLLLADFQPAFRDKRKSAGARLVVSTSSPMSDMADYRKNADQCYELAKQMAKPEDLHAFLEMAHTWEKLADLHELSSGIICSAGTGSGRRKRSLNQTMREGERKGAV
jgi:hypothetical protein